MIFPTLDLEKVVQVGDKTRLSAVHSYTSPDEAAISKIEIRPSVESDFFTVGGNGLDQAFLDWQYSSEGQKTVSLRITVGEGETASAETIEKTIEVITESEDNLFSSDADLIEEESGIYSRLRPGRSTFLDKHRAAQKKILKELDEDGYRDIEGNKLTKSAIADIDAIRDWSKYLTLALIFGGERTQIEDVAHEKAKEYRVKASDAKASAVLRFDYDKDGEIDAEDQFSFYGTVVRR